jgi:dCTP deaminase
MVLSQPQIREEVERGGIRFDPPLVEKQWGEASVDLRLGYKFTKFRPQKNVIFSMADGIGALADTGLYDEVVLEPKDRMGKRPQYILEPGEFVLALTYEHVWIPRHLIGMVEGRSTYARAGLSMHQTAPWIQPGWDGQITLEIRNSGENRIALTPVLEMPCQLTFLKLTSEVPEKHAYGSRSSDIFQNQTSALPTQRGKENK